MNSPAAFHAHGPSHLAALAVIALAGGGLVALARRRPDAAITRACEHSLAGVLVLLTFGRLVVQGVRGEFDVQSALPLHYCDVAAMSGALALLTRRQWPCETAYFFGLAGTLQALVTPALQVDFPAPRFWLFFGSHGAVVITALHVVLGLRHAPQSGAVRRAMIVMTAYAVAVGILNSLLGTNYGFLCAKPPTASLMDYLGPWPWYVGSLWLLGLVFYIVLDLPFSIRRHHVARG
ncbi:MAG: TIGR02206 family membrane protein [Verrucomicrobiaceae bacterium]|nr:TIGR02206 family membrane protein [Verrucomicrobiaceae bacterium]